jgi:hypothetical protein
MLTWRWRSMPSAHSGQCPIRHTHLTPYLGDLTAGGVSLACGQAATEQDAAGLQLYGTPFKWGSNRLDMKGEHTKDVWHSKWLMFTRVSGSICMGCKA